MKRIAFYGGSFDPLHNGHLTIARKLTEIFHLDIFYFIPAFHAPHKKDKKMTPAFCRYAMLALATNDDPKIKISTVELDAPEKPYTFETQAKLKNYYDDSAEIFFVMGADSWAEITTWREWEKVLTQTNIIVVTRPDYEIGFSHITGKIRERIVDLRFQVQGSKFKIPGLSIDFVTERICLPEKLSNTTKPETLNLEPGTKIFITDAVQIDVSATEIKRKIKENETDWRKLVPKEVANYVEKYNLYI